MEQTTMPLGLEESLTILWQKVGYLEAQAQEQARVNYRLKMELNAALGTIGLLMALRLQVEELEEKVKRLESTQPFT